MLGAAVTELFIELWPRVSRRRAVTVWVRLHGQVALEVRGHLAAVTEDPQEMFDAGAEGALCDPETKNRLETIGAEFDWAAFRPAESQIR